MANGGKKVMTDKEQFIALINDISHKHEELQKKYKEQQAEIQSLRKDIHNRKTRENKLRSKIKSFKAEIERLKKGWRADVIETQNIKAEAIKEFADRLKKQFKEDINDIQDSITRITDPDAIDGQYETIATFELSLDYIDNLVKEMVGEGK